MEAAGLSQLKGIRHCPRHPWFGLPTPAVVSLTFPDRPTDDELRGAFDELTRWMHEEVDRPYMFLIYVDKVLSFSPVQRKLVVEAEANYEAVERRYNAGQAMVATAPMQRGIITAFTWMSPPVWPYRVVASEEAALAWLAEQWQRVTVDFPAGPLWTGRLRR